MDTHVIFLTLGSLLLVGLLADEIGRRTRVPRVTLLILFGVTAGPSGLDLLPAVFQGLYEFLAITALTMVAFLLGSRLSFAAMKEHGKEILSVSVAVVIVTILVVSVGLIIIGMPLPLALVIAGIATATAPAATHDVVRQTGAKGPFTDTLLGIVAIDDAWGLIAFSLLLVVAKAILGDGSFGILSSGLWEVGGAILIGVALGLPASYLTGRLRLGEPSQLEALGLVFLCAGFASWSGVSFLLAGIVAGAIVVNCAKHHSRPFHEIEHVEWPFMVFFFVLAGATLHISGLADIWAVAIAFILLRMISRVLGGWIGGALIESKKTHRRWIGLALMPQAGVALGMALVASGQFPQYSENLLALAIGTTVVFELIGPLMTSIALRKVGEYR